MSGSRNRKEARDRRHRRVRKKVQGTAERPRMAICVTGRHQYVQFIDDTAGRTLASASTLGWGARNNKATAAELGKKAAEAARAAGIKSVVVDRGGFRFHGRVKAVVDGAVEAGLVAGMRKGT